MIIKTMAYKTIYRVNLFLIVMRKLSSLLIAICLEISNVSSFRRNAEIRNKEKAVAIKKIIKTINLR